MNYMRLTTLALILLVISALSCETKRLPPGVLTKEQMTDLMIDIYLAEARTMTLAGGRDSLYKIFAHYQDSLLRVKGYPDSTVRKSYGYYLEHTDELEAIYDAIIDSLSLLEQQTRPTPG